MGTFLMWFQGDTFNVVQQVSKKHVLANTGSERILRHTFSSVVTSELLVIRNEPQAHNGIEGRLPLPRLRG